MKQVTITIDLSNIKNEADYREVIENTIQSFGQLEDKFFKSQVINGLRELNAGNKGRISVPDFMKKEKEVKESTGRKGRPADSDEVKLAKLKAKYEEAQAKLAKEELTA